MTNTFQVVCIINKHINEYSTILHSYIMIISHPLTSTIALFCCCAFNADIYMSSETSSFDGSFSFFMVLYVFIVQQILLSQRKIWFRPLYISFTCQPVKEKWDLALSKVFHLTLEQRCCWWLLQRNDSSSASVFTPKPHLVDWWRDSSCSNWFQGWKFVSEGITQLKWVCVTGYFWTSCLNMEP